MPFNLVLPEFKKGKTENVYDNIVKVGSDGKNISLYHPCNVLRLPLAEIYTELDSTLCFDKFSDQIEQKEMF